MRPCVHRLYGSTHKQVKQHKYSSALGYIQRKMQQVNNYSSKQTDGNKSLTRLTILERS